MWTLWIALASAADPAEEDDVSIEIVVQGHRLQEARDALRFALGDLGYRRVLGGDQRGVYFTPKLWKPWVVVDDDGFARVRALRFLPIPGRLHRPEAFPGILQDPGASTLPPVGSVTVATQSRRAASQERARLVSTLEPYLADLREAHWQLAKVERAVALREELVGIWVDGVAADGTPLPTFAERRAALVARARRTTEGEAGEWVRAQIAAYVENVVQVSDHPFGDEELAILR
jgi:hypothetical protein